MTKAIVMNTLTGAVSEYDNFQFQSITPTVAGSAMGLFALGGDTDLGLPIVSHVLTGKTLFGPSVKKFLDLIYFSLLGSGTFLACLARTRPPQGSTPGRTITRRSMTS